jgi:hypothetical protein
LENVEYFSRLGIQTINGARRIRKIKFGIYMANAAFNKKKALFTSKLDRNLWMKPVKCCIWGIYPIFVWC